jgi:hypothetical protein
MTVPIITGVVLTGLGAFLGGVVVSGLCFLIVLKNASYNSQSRTT